MEPIKITGKAVHVSREEARAWIHATLCVLAFHNKPLLRPIHISFVAQLGSTALWIPSGRIKILNWVEADAIFTSIVHELIHECCGDFEEDSDEKCTSTLTARMKQEIAPIAQRLLDGTYKRAAWIAHTKISYRRNPAFHQFDYYDPDQDKPVPWKGRYRKRGTKKCPKRSQSSRP